MDRWAMAMAIMASGLTVALVGIALFTR